MRRCDTAEHTRFFFFFFLDAFLPRSDATMLLFGAPGADIDYFHTRPATRFALVGRVFSCYQAPFLSLPARCFASRVCSLDNSASKGRVCVRHNGRVDAVRLPVLRDNVCPGRLAVLLSPRRCPSASGGSGSRPRQGVQPACARVAVCIGAPGMACRQCLPISASASGVRRAARRMQRKGVAFTSR